MEAILIVFWVFYGVIIAAIGMGITHANNEKAGTIVIIAMVGGAVLSTLTAFLLAPLFGYKFSLKDPDKNNE